MMDRSVTMKKNAGVTDDSSTGVRVRSSGSTYAKGSPNKPNRRKSNSLPPETVDYLKAWMMSPEHIAHPYPTEVEKIQIMADTGIELKQLTNWFVNNRKRFWKPRVEARLQEQAQSQAASAAAAFKQIDTRSTSFNNISLSSFVSANPSSFLGPKQTSLPKSPNTRVTASPARTVSDQSSISSESESVASTDDEILHVSSSTGQPTNEDDANLLTQTEYVNLHVLRPVDGNIPTVEDVTILNNVPTERVLRSFDHCALTYSIPSDAVSNSNKVCAGSRKDAVSSAPTPSHPLPLLPSQIQSCRDAEISRLKKYYLNVFLSQPLTPKRRRLTDDAIATPRAKFRRVSLELWKEACMSAQNSYYDSDLPSLEEAATLFGFANS